MEKASALIQTEPVGCYASRKNLKSMYAKKDGMRNIIRIASKNQ